MDDMLNSQRTVSNKCGIGFGQPSSNLDKPSSSNTPQIYEGNKWVIFVKSTAPTQTRRKHPGLGYDKSKRPAAAKGSQQ